jgi:hippurate hydrolase
MMGPMTDPAELLADAGAELEPAIELRRDLHAHPELGNDLPRTQAAVLDALSGLDLDIATGTSVTSVVATLRGTAGGGDPGRCIVLRGDMDALPMPEDTGLPFASADDGTMHACGHDAHTAMLVGAARLLSRHRDELTGTVRFMFQPGEEGHHGARAMIEEGVLDGPRADGAFAIHAIANLPSGLVATRGGPLMASADQFYLTVTGRGGHASMPHDTLDPIPVACEIVMALQSMVTRRVSVFDPAVVTVARITAGTTTNVIPEVAKVSGTIRTLSPATRRAVLEQVRRVAEGVASAHGAGCEVSFDEGYPVTVNDAGFADFARSVASRLLGAERTMELPTPVMGAEDWSYVLQEVPGAMAFLGVCPPEVAPSKAEPNHSNRMVLHEAAMTAGIATYAAVATEFLAGGGEPSGSASG